DVRAIMLSPQMT
ncbi:unnamed protein product, partial [Rotaria magnacalcarata]